MTLKTTLKSCLWTKARNIFNVHHVGGCATVEHKVKWWRGQVRSDPSEFLELDGGIGRFECDSHGAHWFANMLLQSYISDVFSVVFWNVCCSPEGVQQGADTTAMSQTDQTASTRGWTVHTDTLSWISAVSSAFKQSGTYSGVGKVNPTQTHGAKKNAENVVYNIFKHVSSRRRCTGMKGSNIFILQFLH